MITNSYNVIGVMSGTSLDGVDLAYITFTKEHQWKFQIHVAETISYTDEWLRILKQLLNFNLNELKQVDADYTIYLSTIINQFIDKNNIQNLDAICSHGHTALHQPEKSLTYQIGNLPTLAKLIRQTVVCDFRVADVTLGGQGAPLVPIGDALLFSRYDFCLNLGGFANISTEINNERIAYDICPVNIVLNHYISPLGIHYDDKGQMAATGTVHQTLLDNLNALEFYKKAHPKSLGIEWVMIHIFPLIDRFQLSTADILRTFTEHIAIQIANEINTKQNATVFITGGGAYHSFLIERLQSHTKNTLVIPDKEIVEFKEALIFGLLGVLKLRDEVNCLSSVTGAKMNHSSGKIYNP
jgi:anhydro-N-acetylmuramic acid kinase